MQYSGIVVVLVAARQEYSIADEGILGCFQVLGQASTGALLLFELPIILEMSEAMMFKSLMPNHTKRIYMEALARVYPASNGIPHIQFLPRKSSWTTPVDTEAMMEWETYKDEADAEQERYR